jgi:hypothetical protein
VLFHFNFIQAFQLRRLAGAAVDVYATGSEVMCCDATSLARIALYGFPFG